MRNSIKVSNGERVLEAVIYAMLLLVTIVTLYPLYHVVMASFSEPGKLITHEGLLLLPEGFSLLAYQAVLRSRSIFVGYGNTVFYVAAGSILNVLFTIIGAYVLSRKYLKLRKFLTLMFVFTMYFGGGLIPTYLQVQNLHLLNTRWSLILPGLINTYNLIIMRTAFASIPVSLEESARLDGAGELKILFRIFVPLSMPTIAVMFLYYGVGHWNSWFNAMIYLRDRMLYPLQLFLREILIQNDMNDMMAGGGGGTNEAVEIGMTIKYATIIVSTLPIMFVYPFVQKFFVSGVMIGAVKE